MHMVGTAGGLWRFPVKSMQGEEIETAYVTERGLLGDRVYALIDTETGKVVSEFIATFGLLAVIWGVRDFEPAVFPSQWEPTSPPHIGSPPRHRLPTRP
jgi:hypothetical protein